jgi:hypothetical protein
VKAKRKGNRRSRQEGGLEWLMEIMMKKEVEAWILGTRNKAHEK